MTTQRKKGGIRMRWMEIDAEDVRIGDYVKGRTETNSQKHGSEYNFTVRGTVIQPNDHAYNIIVKTSKGKIKNLCANVGTSGYNSIDKAVDKQPPPGIFGTLMDTQLTGFKIRKRTTSPSSSISSSNASSIEE